MKPESFLYDESHGVARIRLNRPDRLNALTFQVYEELRDCFFALEARDTVKVVTLTGEGRGFCSGGDVEDIIGPLFDRDLEGRAVFTRVTCDLVRNIRRLRKPVIAGLNGVVAGAGAVIALASDFRIATPYAKIAFLFTKVGLSGADMGAAWMLPRVVGMSRATEMLMLGEFVSPQQAVAYGLYREVVEPDQLHEAMESLAQKLMEGPAFGVAMTKEMLNAEASMSLEQALDAEARVQAWCMEHPDYRTAFEAFMSKKGGK
ncbi:MAG: enoyl-CoA hydratase family protein [Planctomycetota bacterium]